MRFFDLKEQVFGKILLFYGFAAGFFGVANLAFGDFAGKFFFLQ